jgi:signal transduction histidine kinase
MPRPIEKVLIVDDARLSSSLKQSLSGHFNVVIAEDADQALQCLSNRKDIGAMIAYVGLQEKNGAELLAGIGQQSPDIRRIILAEAPDVRNATDAGTHCGAFRCFHKSCDPEEMALAINEALEEYRFLTQSADDRAALEIQAQAGDRARQAFLSMISHELLTPLNHVIGFSSILETKLEGANEEALEYLEHIKDGGETLLKLMKRVLEIVRLTSEDAADDRMQVNVGELISRELDVRRKDADAMNITLSFQTPPEPVIAYVNDHKLRFVLRELIENAIKFNRRDGQVSVAVTNKIDRLTIRVADTGRGMSREVVNAALGRFTLSEDIEHRSTDDVGLGVTFAVFFARAYGGNFAIESEKGVGTAIILTLPCRKPEEVVLPRVLGA